VSVAKVTTLKPTKFIGNLKCPTILTMNRELAKGHLRMEGKG
jgi:hypothetical protein